ncbi:hypothetical protein ACFL0V_02440 [Nanoarchaeota archaeon]
MDWDECNTKNYVKRISVDTELVESLIISSEKRFHTAERLKVDDTTASTLVTLYYDTLRELLEAQSILKGFKIYNHDCYCAFLKEVLVEKEIGDSFDRFRKIRNGINYYGKDIDVQSAADIIEEIKVLIDVVKKKIGGKNANKTIRSKKD